MTFELTPEMVVAYFVCECDGVKQGDLRVEVKVEDVVLRVARYLDGDVWCSIMDYVEAMNGEWSKGGPWTIPRDRVEERVIDLHVNNWGEAAGDEKLKEAIAEAKARIATQGDDPTVSKMRVLYDVVQEMKKA